MIKLLNLEFKLRHQEFQTTTTSKFQELWNDQYYSDVTLATADDKQIRAHKIILCSNSAFDCMTVTSVII